MWLVLTDKHLELISTVIMSTVNLSKITIKQIQLRFLEDSRQICLLSINICCIRFSHTYCELITAQIQFCIHRDNQVFKHSFVIQCRLHTIVVSFSFLVDQILTKVYNKNSINSGLLTILWTELQYHMKWVLTDKYCELISTVAISILIF